MRHVTLGKTGIAVSRLCFGTLTLGPLQANLPLEEGAEILAHAIRQGVTFFDTAQIYQTYPYLRRAMKLAGRYDITIATKTYAHTREQTALALEEARRELGRDVIDIFLLHEQESEHTLRGHTEALEYLLEQKQRGVIRAAGASMHYIAAVDGAVGLGLDVIHPLLNMRGLGIADGARADMEAALLRAHKSGTGIYSMKPLGGGVLFREADKCLAYITALQYIDSVAIGMQNVEEVDANIDFFREGRFPGSAKIALENKARRLHIADWCEGCGRCAVRCRQRALRIQGGTALCEREKCVLCGYCAAVCPVLAIKIV